MRSLLFTTPYPPGKPPFPAPRRVLVLPVGTRQPRYFIAPHFVNGPVSSKSTTDHMAWFLPGP